jgi:hypothetical protein
MAQAVVGKVFRLEDPVFLVWNPSGTLGTENTELDIALHWSPQT